MVIVLTIKHVKLLPKERSDTSKKVKCLSLLFFSCYNKKPQSNTTQAMSIVCFNTALTSISFFNIYTPRLFLKRVCCIVSIQRVPINLHTLCVVKAAYTSNRLIKHTIESPNVFLYRTPFLNIMHS